MDYRFLATCGAAFLGAAASAQLNYFNDFENPVGAEWSNTSRSSTPTGGRQFLGEFNNQDVTLTLTSVPVGQTVTVAFDLFVIRSWDGSGGPGPDNFKLSVDGGSTLLDATFSNVGNTQSYPTPGSAPRTGADESNTLGYSYFYGDTVYKFGGANNPSFTFTSTASTLVLRFGASGLQEIGDEAWGIDNVRVTAPVPEPATFAVLGLGVVAAIRRRRSR